MISIQTLLPGLALLLSAGCAATPLRQVRVLRLQVVPAAAFQSSHRVDLRVTGPDGVMRQVGGEVSRGGTTGALARSIMSSLRAQGCQATYGAVNADADQLTKAMNQLLVLPDEWSVSLPVLVEALDEQAGRWLPSTQLEISAEVD